MFKIGGFAEQLRLPVQIHERVRSQHEGIGKSFRHGARLAIGVDLSHLPRGQLVVMDFARGTRHDLKHRRQLPQQFRAAR